MQRITIVTPANPHLQNGNWSTTVRWRDFLRSDYKVTITQEWDGDPCDLMLALHARKSAASIRRFSELKKPLVVVLTGTDVYRDIKHDAIAIESLELATKMIVLQSKAPEELAPELGDKCVVIEQSAPRMPPLEPRSDTFDLLLVGHMRAVKDPLTALRALSHVEDPTIRLRHIGLTSDEVIGPKAERLKQHDPRIEFLGLKSHDETRDLIRRGRVLLLPSRLEGGANVLIEAVMSSVPVLASSIPGSIGLLGAGYEGYFPVGDDRQMAKLIERAISQPEWLENLQCQCQEQAHLFEPDRECRLLIELVRSLLAGGKVDEAFVN